MSAAPTLAVVGIGEDGLAGLGRHARALVATAEVFVGGARHLAMLGHDPRPRLAWRSPLSASLDELGGLGGRQVVVLASGDPLWFGVAGLLRRALPDWAIEVVPAVSSFQLAAARLGWALDETLTVSLHGRPLACLHRWLVRGRRLLCLTDGAEAPGTIADLLAGAGYGAAGLAVLERLGGPAERVRWGRAAAPPSPPYDPLNLVALDLRAAALPPGLGAAAGLPDNAFAHDGQLTKAEVRAVTLAALAPRDGTCLWDVGAGAGSVAIEWLRLTRHGAALAIERVPARAANIKSNAAGLGVPELMVVEGTAPDCLAGLPRPDAVFVGGGIARPGLLDACWTHLQADGRLLANAVTIRGEQALVDFAGRHGGTLTRLEVARAAPLGGELAWRPLLPVTQLLVVKRR